jgi:hypothetical protein
MTASNAEISSVFNIAIGFKVKGVFFALLALDGRYQISVCHARVTFFAGAIEPMHGAHERDFMANAAAKRAIELCGIDLDRHS